MNQSSCGLLYGIAGTSGPPMRITGASRSLNASSAISAAISAPAPNMRLSSYTTKHLPVFRASPGHPDHHGNAPRAVGAITHPGGLVDDLLESRSAEVRELHLRDRHETTERRADGDANDARFGDRRVDDAIGAELFDEPVGY